MLKKFFPAVLAIAALPAFMSSCGEKGPKPLKTVFETYGKAHTYVLEGVKSDFVEDDDMSVCDSVALILPVTINDIDTKAFCDTIIWYALGQKDLTAFEAIDKWLEETAAETGYKFHDTNVAPNLADGFEFVEGRIVNMTSDLLTYCIANSSMHPGAANGLYTLTYLNYSLKSNSIVRLSDLFTPEGLKALPEVIARQAEDNPRYAGELNIDSLPEDGNFFLSSEGEIVFSYQPMEVGPHSLGNVQIAFYPAELVDYMTPAAIREFGLTDLTPNP